MPPRTKKKKLTLRQKTEIATLRRKTAIARRPRKALEHLAEMFDAFTVLEKVAENAELIDPFERKNPFEKLPPAAICAYFIHRGALKDHEKAVVESLKCYASEYSTERTVGFSWIDPANPTIRKSASISIHYTVHAVKQD